VAGLTIGKLCFGADAFAYGLELCLARAARSAYRVTTATAGAVDVLLVTIFWYADYYRLEAFYRQSGIRPGGKPIIIIGGMQATMTPKLAACFADYVFVGDADEHLGGILDQIESGKRPEHPNLYRAGAGDLPSPCECEPSAFAIGTGSCHSSVRIEIARGCRFKCAFCCLSGLKPYKEVRASEIEPLLQAHHGRALSLFAPERTMHSEFDRIVLAAKRYGCKDMGQDARLDRLEHVSGSSVTFGLEGLSQRLRKTIGKPWSNAEVVERLGRFVETRKNISRVSMYLIADLPGEMDDDWTEFRELFLEIERADWSRRLVLCPILNPLSPKPYTALEKAHIRLFSDYASRWRRLLRKEGGQWGFRIIETFVWGPLERTMDAIVHRAPAEAAAWLIRRMPTPLLLRKPRMDAREGVARALIAEIGKQEVTLNMLEGTAP